MQNNTVNSQLGDVAQRPGIDLEGFRRELQANGLDDLVDELIETFLQDAPSRFEALENAIGAADAEQIRCAAHAYRSASATMHARQLAGLLAEVEAAGRAGDSVRPGALLAPLRREHEEVLRQLRQSGADAPGA